MNINCHLPTILLLFISLLVGCADINSRPMALSKTTGVPPAPDKAILLMSVTLGNDYRKIYKPELQSVTVAPAQGDPKSKIHFNVDKTTKIENKANDKTNKYIVSLELEKGKYSLEFLRANPASIFFPGSFYDAPLLLPLDVDRSGLIYIGNVKAIIRERVEGEFRAGPLVPLLDQAIVGASGGTFDISVNDDYDSDILIFKDKYPALQTAEIFRQIMPEFDRSKAQSWWEAR